MNIIARFTLLMLAAMCVTAVINRPATAGFVMQCGYKWVYQYGCRNQRCGWGWDSVFKCDYVWVCYPYNCRSPHARFQEFNAGPQTPSQSLGIYFGKPAGSYPFQVALIYGATEAGKEYEGQFCAGTLIDKRWVLTAGHCTVTQDDDGNVVPVKPQDVQVYVGSQNFTGGDRINVAKVITHPKFDAETLDFDVGLLLLARAPNDAKVATIALVDAADEETYAAPKTKVTAVGWGATEIGEYPKELREVSIEMLDRKMCNSGTVQYRLDRAQNTLHEIKRQLGVKENAMKQIKDLLANNTGDIVTDNMVCAGIEPSGENTCSGDNGGPLFVETPDKKFIQVGIVSWGDTCGSGEKSLYGIYTRLANFNAWIKETMQSTPVSDEAAEPAGGK